MTRPEDVRSSVSDTYTRAVQATAQTSGGCCSGPAPTTGLSVLAGYSREALAALPADAVLSSFGCGNPVALADIREGDTVLDLGSGAGIDLLLAGKLAGPRGRAIGVDMTDAMLDRARANARAAGLENVEVRKGIIEQLPVPDGSVDILISNCVINLSPEKERVFAEIHRVLKPGGRFAISDIVAETLPDWVATVSLLYSACISGAIPEADYVAGLASVGLVDIAVRERIIYDEEAIFALLGACEGGSCCDTAGLPAKTAREIARTLAGKVASVRVVGRRTVEESR